MLLVIRHAAGSLQEVETMDDVKLALLGNKEAAKRLTERGEMLPCPKCKGVVTLHSVNGFKSIYASCRWCGIMTRGFKTASEAIKAWNTRAPILTPEELEGLK